MILQTAPSDIAVVNGATSVNEFRFTASAKAFSIMSNSLYADKITAIVRELSCNAYDSHVAAGNTSQPFEVHLPTALEPWFTVRDFGVGLSADDIVNIYTVYFESTKTASNDFTGALGLGSKSPFSYTNTFTVTAVKDGVKSVYSAFINDAGIPAVANLYTGETAESNGVEVTFAVGNSSDQRKFANSAENILRWFPKNSVTVTGTEISPVEFTETNIVPGVHVLDSHRNSNLRRVFARMGNVVYPIDASLLSPAGRTILSDAAATGILIDFAIGELDFQPSREGLSYIPQTVATLDARVAALEAALVEILTARFDAIPNFWKRAAEISKHRDISLWRSAARAYLQQTKFPISSDHVPISRHDVATKFNITVTHQRTTGMQRRNAAPRFAGTPAADSMYLTVSSETVFVVNDTRRGAIPRVRAAILDKSIDVNPRVGVYLLQPADPKDPMRVEDFLKSIYSPPTVLKVSSLPESTAEKRSKKTAVHVLKLAVSCELKNMRWSTVDDLPEEDDGVNYYVPLSGFVVQNDALTDFKEAVQQLCGMCDSASQRFGTVYGVRAAALPEIETLPNWVRLEVGVQEFFEKNRKQLVRTFVQHQVARHCETAYNKLAIAAKSAPDASVFRKFVCFDTSKGANWDYCNVPAITGTARTFGLRKQHDEIIAEAAQMQTEIQAAFTKYPLLEAISRIRIDSKTVNAIVEYVNLIDNSHKE